MKRKRVLVAPLDWGLGHVTRCIPLIDCLLTLDCEVLIAGSGPSLTVLQREFPGLVSFDLPGYTPEYTASGSMVIKMGLQTPKFLRTIQREQTETGKLVALHDIDLVISDNRYGCRSDAVPSIFITHQLNILMPTAWRWMETAVNSINRYFIRQFSDCWVPDFPDSKLSGKLSSANGVKAKFIGPLTRFENTVASELTYDVVAVLSGPEPQRSVFEKILVDQMVGSQLKCLLVRGVPGEKRKYENEPVEIIDYLDSGELLKVLSESKMVLARPGYSTIMDMARLGKKVIFVPTPGQTEQEYLAQRFDEMQIAPLAGQDSFSLANALTLGKQYSGFQPYISGDLWQKQSLMETLKQTLQNARC